MKLPEKVTVTLEKVRLDAELAVKWTEGNYNGDVAGTYTLEGTLQLTDGIQNPKDMKAEIKVIVGDSSTPDPDPNPDPKPDQVDKKALKSKLDEVNKFYLWLMLFMLASVGTVGIVSRRKRTN